VDSARQLIRWSVPGGVFMLLGFTTALITGVIWSRHEVAGLIGDPSLAAMAVVAGAASVPIGFTIYQIYFVVFQEINFPLARRWLLPTDRGLEILRQLDPSAVAFIASNCRTGIDLWSDRYRKKGQIRRYREAREQNWSAIQWLLATHLDDADARARTEYTNLSDIYHSLGASRMAVALACVSYTSLFTYLYHDPALNDLPRALATGCLVIALFVASFVVFHVGRFYAHTSLVRILTNLLHTALCRDGESWEGVQKRRHRRHTVLASTAHLTSNGSACSGGVLNASRGGLAVLLSEPPASPVDEVAVRGRSARRCLKARRVRIAATETLVGADGPAVLVRLAFTNSTQDELWVSQACGYG